MTDNSPPPGTPPPPRSPLPGPSGSQDQEAIDLPRALSVAENLSLAIQEAQSQTRVPRTQGKLGLVNVCGGADSRGKCYFSTLHWSDGQRPLQIRFIVVTAPPTHIIRESVDSLCRDGADAQYMQYLTEQMSYNFTTNTLKVYLSA